jgi:hypothetical protein
LVKGDYLIKRKLNSEITEADGNLGHGLGKNKYKKN